MERRELCATHVVVALLLGMACAAVCFPAHAGLTLSSDWEESPPCIGTPRNAQELADSQQGRRPKGYCPPGEIAKLKAAANKLAQRLTSVPVEGRHAPQFEAGFKLRFDGTLFYVKPSMFAARDKDGEVCTPADFKNVPTYMCEEGQRFAASCHLLFFTRDMQPAGALRLHINEPFRAFCNAMPALGVANKNRNELLVILQYFDIGTKPATSAAELASTWRRMTVLVRIEEVDGRIVAEQDDSCLRNPNTIETVPDARSELKRCTAKQR